MPNRPGCGGRELWVGAVALGLAFAVATLGVFVTFRVLAFLDLAIDDSFPLGVAVSAIMIVRAWDPWFTLLIAAARFVGLGPTDMRRATSLIVVFAPPVPSPRRAVVPRAIQLGTARA